MKNILFVCLGNICRSPLAEGFLRHHVGLNNMGERFNIDSAGTGNWHVGSPADNRAVRAAAELGVDIASLRARQLQSEDFARFQRVIAMDRNNLTDLQGLSADNSNNVHLDLLSDLIEGLGFIDVPDPWYGSYIDFQAVALQLDSACAALAERLQFNG